MGASVLRAAWPSSRAARLRVSPPAFPESAASRFSACSRARLSNVSRCSRGSLGVRKPSSTPATVAWMPLASVPLQTMMPTIQ